jgi:RHS repeat-associated protein
MFKKITACTVLVAFLSVSLLQPLYAQLAWKHVFMGDKRLCSIDQNGDTFYYHYDARGNVNIITDKNGQVTQRIEYTPYGKVAFMEVKGADNLMYRFSGKQYDATTELIYYGHRYYDPELGRWIAPDPTVQKPYDPQDLNRYAYCRNNPITLDDPNGLGWWSKFWDKIFKPLISAVTAVVAVWLIPSFVPLIAQYGFATVAGTSAIAAGGATATLDTGVGRQFVRGFAHGLFDNVLGMSPNVANFFASFLSQTVLSSAYFVGLSAFTMPANYAGPDYTKPENRSGEFLEHGKEAGEFTKGGNSANNMRLQGAKPTYVKEGMVVGDTGFKNIPVAKEIFGALQINHSASLVNFNGKLLDSSSFSLWFGKAGYSGIKGLAIFGAPWTGVCHQSVFNTLMASGSGVFEAFSGTMSGSGWSFLGSTAIYGPNGAFGLSGIYNAETSNEKNINIGN